MTERVNETVFPTVSVDVAYGEKVRDLTIDFDLITQHLRSRGMSDEQISELSIHFSPNVFEATGKRTKKSRQDSQYETLGQFSKETNRIDIHKPQSWFAFYATGGDLKGMGINADGLTGAELSETLVHELEHYIQTTDETLQQDVETYNKWRIKLLRGKLADSILKYMVAASGVAMTSTFASDALDEGLASFGPSTNSVASIGLSIATLAAYFTTSRIMHRELDEKAGSHNRESYLHRPSEVEARYAEKEYPLKLISLESVPVACETYDDVVKQAQGSFTRRIIDGLRLPAS